MNGERKRRIKLENGGRKRWTITKAAEQLGYKDGECNIIILQQRN